MLTTLTSLFLLWPVPGLNPCTMLADRQSATLGIATLDIGIWKTIQPEIIQTLHGTPSSYVADSALHIAVYIFFHRGRNLPSCRGAYARRPERVITDALVLCSALLRGRILPHSMYRVHLCCEYFNPFATFSLLEPFLMAGSAQGRYIAPGLL
jgi:hypothetical protein